MARARGRTPRTLILRDTEPPLEDRVDKYGERQRAGVGRDSRAAGRRSAAAAEGDVPGWWHFSGEEWTYHGNEDEPA